MTDFAVLGPLLVDGRADVVAASRQRAVVELLVLRAPNPVSVHELRAGLWGEEAPSTAA